MKNQEMDKRIRTIVRIEPGFGDNSCKLILSPLSSARKKINSVLKK